MFIRRYSCIAPVKLTVLDIPPAMFVRRYPGIIPVQCSIPNIPPTMFIGRYPGIIPVQHSIFYIPPAIFIICDPGISRINSSIFIHIPVSWSCIILQTISLNYFKWSADTPCIVPTPCNDYRCSPFLYIILIRNIIMYSFRQHCTAVLHCRYRRKTISCIGLVRNCADGQRTDGPGIYPEILCKFSCIISNSRYNYRSSSGISIILISNSVIHTLSQNTLCRFDRNWRLFIRSIICIHTAGQLHCKKPNICFLTGIIARSHGISTLKLTRCIFCISYMSGKAGVT